AARAERVVFRFFKRIGATGAHSVAIAGNHDSPDRFEAWGALTELVNVWAIGRPKAANDGGVLDLKMQCGERAVIAAVPFASQRRLVSALDVADGDDVAMKKYADQMTRIVRSLCGSFRNDAVNLLCLHTHLEGAIKGTSERQVHLGEDWAALPATLPPNAHYIALGHIHKPQTIPAPSPAYYAGSPLQLDFGEAGIEKSFVVIEAQPGPRPAKIARVAYVGGKPLRRFAGTLQELEQKAEELKQDGWLRVIVKVDKRDPDVNRRVRKLLPNAVSVDVEAPALSSDAEPASSDDSYAEFHRQRHGKAPSAELLAAFDQLRAEAEKE
ncbi:MAG: exonuclease SbcCD subunit D, partial [Bryobacterales bacterium]|nr:exonuclease SbcCD subunit D [Bryobacterales bacterium]